MNINALQEAIRERDEAREHADTTVNTLRKVQMDLDEAVALLRRYRLVTVADPIESDEWTTFHLEGRVVEVIEDTDSFLYRLDGKGRA